ncbi:MAG TPA: hypothetical protein DCQ28_02105, partial [Bacteroidetes bacterium]|nr:hypothetical protein [Bacteroidota bacterium]
MKNTKQIFFVLLFCSLSASAQILNDMSYQLVKPNVGLHPQLSNTITDIVITNDTIWLGTGKGLSRSTDGGRTWKNYYGTREFGTEDISALAVRGKDVWVATAHSVDKDGQSLPEGSGLRYSSDGGTSWKVIAQPIDINNIDTLFYNSKSLIRALGITTAINNITYDIAISGNAVWICSFAGMARRSTDNGTTWQRVIIPPDNLTSISPNDSLVFDLSPSGGALQLQNNLNHRAFSVIAENDSIIWIGTAGGINKTTNGGLSWVKFSKQTQVNPISGNFVVALMSQKTTTKNIIWAATIAASDNTEKKGVSFSDNGGLSWKQTLLGEFAHNFGFNDSLNIVYVPTDNGIFRSSDFGNSWIQTGTIYDRVNRQQYTQSKFFSAAASGDTAWFGGSDGLVSAIDNSSNYFGSNWTISHASQPLSSQTETYAYPNPFAPDDEIVRIHYSTGKTNTAKVTLRIFD